MIRFIKFMIFYPYCCIVGHDHNNQLATIMDIPGSYGNSCTVARDCRRCSTVKYIFGYHLDMMQHDF